MSIDDAALDELLEAVREHMREDELRDNLVRDLVLEEAAVAIEAVADRPLRGRRERWRNDCRLWSQDAAHIVRGLKS